MNMKKALSSHPDVLGVLRGLLDHAELNGMVLHGYIMSIRDGLAKFDLGDETEARLGKLLDEAVVIEAKGIEAVKAWAVKEKKSLGF